MTDDFEIVDSDKLRAEEGYVVVRGRTSYLRILGGDPRWNVMTATASEDRGRIRVCADRKRLVRAAFRVSVEYGCEPRAESDRAGREYVRIGTLTREPGDSDRDLQEDLEALCRRFFEIFDERCSSGPNGDGGTSELYEALKTDERGGDVYLSDGVWLSRDGSLHDRGR